MTDKTIKLDWVDALKAFAIIAILLNHSVEAFNSIPWFSNPSTNWPSFAERMSNVFPQQGTLTIRIVQFLGWLGDMGPGIFIFASGLTLTLSALNKPKNTLDFYKSRIIRIYPLYITIHLIILFVAKFIFKWNIHILSPYNLLSLLGLRFTNGLFYYLNPSWWFIWLIIQMYIFFPLLIYILKKKGATNFLVLTFVITILSRIAGIFHNTLHVNLFIWETGLFAGTRLFEFTFGMYIGYLLKEKNSVFIGITNNPKLALISIITYIAGFVASWTYAGSVISNILITIGLSGIFYSLYKFAFSGETIANKSLIWVGKNSFSVFLLHQPFIIYFGSRLVGYDKALAIGLIVILSFPAGQVIERLTNALTQLIHNNYEKIHLFLKGKIGYILIRLLLAGSTVIGILLFLGFLRNEKYFYLLCLLQFGFLLYYRILIKPHIPIKVYRFLDLAIVISFAVLVLNRTWLPIYWLLIISSFVILTTFKRLVHWASLAVTLLILIISIGISENYFRKFSPIETNTWGERPALQLDSQTIYSLIPNKITHLRYNNYDYYTKTNSLGFNSPEIPFKNKSKNEIRIMVVGDAFTMPEGIEYEFSYPALLERRLSTEFPSKIIHVINAGVTGYGPIEEEAQLKKFIGIVKPDIVINQLFINEYSDINDNAKTLQMQIGLIKNKFYKRGLLGGAMFPIEINLYINKLLNSKSYRNYCYYKSLTYFYEKGSNLYSDTVIAKMDTFLVDMKRMCKQEKTDYIVLGVPGQVEVEKPNNIAYFPYSVNLTDSSKFDLDLPLHTFQKLCSKNNIDYINSKKFLKNEINQPVYFPESWHWNRNGHLVISELLYDYLKSNPLFSNSKLISSSK